MILGVFRLFALYIVFIFVFLSEIRQIEFTLDKEKEFEVFFKQRYQHAHHFALQMIGDEEACHDIVEDSFEVLWKRFDEIGSESRVAFLFRLIRYKCADILRRNQTSSLYAQRYLQSHDDSHDPNMVDIHEERINQITMLMEKLTPRTRQILHECYFNHRSYTEVARQLDISTSAVKKHMIQALKFLRENIVK